jgi:CTP:molybdopterin cytidylyltransferase MocA
MGSSAFNKTACLILSGGLSTRMKEHKALLAYSQKENFLQHIISVYRETGINNIVVIKNSEVSFNSSLNHQINVITNNFSEKGRLYSIKLGLETLQDVMNYFFIQNIDNPFVTVQIIKKLFQQRMKADYIIPEFQGNGGHPILISSEVANDISKTADYQKTLKQHLQRFSSFRVNTENPDCLVNINYPDEYQFYFPANQLTSETS